MDLTFNLGDNATTSSDLPSSITSPGALDFQVSRSQTNKPIIITVNGTTQGATGNYSAQFYDPAVPNLQLVVAEGACLTFIGDSRSFRLLTKVLDSNGNGLSPGQLGEQT